jgi:hypothetical protein
MYLYRRQGPKKRPKPNNSSRKPRTPQKGLPNSARDLLPLIQPATKALAQMLAGRTNASGQLGHARAVLAQVERLMGERAHNRLNPAEREEFFEQTARLRLTLADADSEAEVQAQENEEPAPTAPPVKLERLKELALALTTPSNADAAKSAPNDGDQDAAAGTDDRQDDDSDESEEKAAAVSDEPKEAVDPNRLRLPRGNGERVSIRPESVKVEASARRKAAVAESKRAAVAAVKSKSAKARAEAPKAEGRKKGVPEGWIIDDEGFVVPGAG